MQSMYKCYKMLSRYEKTAQPLRLALMSLLLEHCLMSAVLEGGHKLRGLEEPVFSDFKYRKHLPR